MEKESIIKFIEKYTPTFEKSEKGYSMFTIPTQRIKDNNVENLIERGIKIAKEQNGKSSFRYLIDKIEESEDIQKSIFRKNK